MSVLSRTRTPRTEGKVHIPEPRTPATGGSAPAEAAPRRVRPGALLAAGIVAAAALGTAVWAVVDDGATSPATPGPVAPGNVGAESDVLSERIAREIQRDNARSGTFAR